MTAKQEQLIAVFEELCAKHALGLVIDPAEYQITSPAALDIEHDERGQLVGIGIYDGTSPAFYFTMVTDCLRERLSGLSLIAHNGIGDIESLRQWGVPIRDSQLVHDTMLIGHLIDSSLKSYGLKDMAARELGIVYPEYDEIVGKHKGKTKKAPACPRTESDCCGRVTLDKQPVKLTAMYNAFDTYCTYKLFEKQRKAIGNECV